MRNIKTTEWTKSLYCRVVVLRHVCVRERDRDKDTEREMAKQQDRE